MRQIKFRAFHPKTQKYLVHDWEIGDGDDGYICKDENGELVYSGDLIWEQFTDVNDTGNVEIYEGDVILCENKKWEVKFKLGGWYLWNSGKNDEDRSESWYLFVAKNPKIIGNIHQNPELLP